MSKSEDGGRFTNSIKFFGIEFAPVYIPIERRLQTLAVFLWMSLFLCLGLVCSIVLIWLLYTDFKWITYLYAAWVVYDWRTPYTGGRNNNFMRGWRIWKHFANYFPITLVKTADLDPKRSYLLGSHPHGVLCAGAFCTFATDAMDFCKVFPGLTPRLLTLQGQFWFPGYRELFLSSGACSATKDGMESLLRIPNGQATILVVGGALEALNGDKDCVRLVLNRRKGFIKLALRFGVDLVPTFSFGENSIYDLVDNPPGSKLRKIQEVAENFFGFPPAFFVGRGVFQYNYGIVPYRNAITVVIGKPIRVEKIENPTSEDILSMHKKYVEGIEELYEKYNPIYGDKDKKLIIE